MAGYNNTNRKVEPEKKDWCPKPSSLVHNHQQVPEYSYSPPTKAASVKNNTRPRLSSPVCNAEEVMVPKYDYSSQARVEPVNSEKLRRPSSSVLDCSPKVENEASRPKPLPLSSTNLHNIPNSTGQGGTTGYGGKYTNYNNSDGKKSSDNTMRDENNKDYGGLTESTIARRDGREKGQKGWTTQPSPDSTLPKSTNDISKVVPDYQYSSSIKVEPVMINDNGKVPEYEYSSPKKV